MNIKKRSEKIRRILISIESNYELPKNFRLKKLRSLYNIISQHGCSREESSKIVSILIRMYLDLSVLEKGPVESIIFDRLVDFERIDDLCSLSFKELETSYKHFLHANMHFSVALLHFKNMERLFDLIKSGKKENLFCLGNVPTPGPYEFEKNLQMATAIFKSKKPSVLSDDWDT